MIQKREVLYLNLMKEFYDEIESGKKVIEYRSLTEYYHSRFKGRDYKVVVFVNGYSPTAPKMAREVFMIKKTKYNYEIYLGKKVPIPKFYK